MSVAEIPFGDPPWYIDAADLLKRGDPGPTPWLVEDLIVDQALAAVVGKWKTTKSYGVLDICIAIATGEPAFGVFAIPDPGPVIFVNEEAGEASLWRRLDALCRGRAIRPELLRGRLFVAPGARMKLDDEEWQARLVDFGTRVRPRLFAFDPLARMKAPGRKENAQEEMATVIEFMLRLRSETAAGVLFVHHTGHTGEHMRGSSDLESAWETRLRWKRDGQSPEVTIESEHRDGEPGTFRYRIAWDGLTRSMRFEAVEDPAIARLRDYLAEHPDASAYQAHKDLGGKRKSWFVKTVRDIREDGSEAGNLPGTYPSDQWQGDGSREGLFEAPGTALPDAPLETVPRPGAVSSEMLCKKHGATTVKSVSHGISYLACGCFVEAA